MQAEHSHISNSQIASIDLIEPAMVFLLWVGNFYYTRENNYI